MGRQADKIGVDFEIFKIKFSTGYTIQTFILFNITVMLLQYYNCISVGFHQVELTYFEICFEMQKMVAIISCQSLLLGTNILNDNYIS